MLHSYGCIPEVARSAIDSLCDKLEMPGAIRTLGLCCLVFQHNPDAFPYVVKLYDAITQAPRTSDTVATEFTEDMKVQMNEARSSWNLLNEYKLHPPVSGCNFLQTGIKSHARKYSCYARATFCGISSSRRSIRFDLTFFFKKKY
jgi:hypothetical protein